MSRAFVKEPDGDAVSDDSPELPISADPNFVTAAGLAQLQKEQSTLLEQRVSLKASDDPVGTRLALLQVERRLRYVNARLDSAILKTEQGGDTVVFGAVVTAVDENDEEYRFQIVGEDEANIDQGKISYVSPLASALLGASIGDLVRWRRPKGDLELEILSIRYS